MSSLGACCSIPPAAHDYTPVGVTKDVQGMQTYVTGEENATTSIVFIYDIFGLKYSQSKQLADILAKALQAKLYIPDFLHGNVFDKASFMQIMSDPNSDKSSLQQFFQTHGEVGKNTATVSEFLKVLKQETKPTKLGLVGFCWGGKVATMVARQSDLIDAVGSCHPAMVNPDDANALRVPICFLPSKDEPEAECATFIEKVKANPKIAALSVAQRFDTMPHGWLAAVSFLDLLPREKWLLKCKRSEVI